ncbi:hypothetical protein FACS1894176_04780 [Bacteroidia bacterium]|nr:hypothetical protein FACS1894176_04780 [Bacteroidia bacterium]
MEKAIEKVENCFKTCDGLAFDKKLACKAMCICEKRDSSDIDLRDPYKTPGLGPILIVKVCTVPSTNRNFSSRGVTVQSIEEVYGQLFGVVDTLDKSGELGITEQQKEFLDNPASNINFAKSLTFTFDQFIQKRAAVQEVSKQLKEKQTKAEHTILLETLGIANPLDNPESINAYVLVQNPATMTMEGNMMAQVQYDAEVEKQTDLSETPKPMVEPNDTANRTKNIELENTITVFLSQHQMFWIDIETTMREFQTLSKVLLDKK